MATESKNYLSEVYPLRQFTLNSSEVVMWVGDYVDEKWPVEFGYIVASRYAAVIVLVTVAVSHWLGTY